MGELIQRLVLPYSGLLIKYKKELTSGIQDLNRSEVLFCMKESSFQCLPTFNPIRMIYSRRHNYNYGEYICGWKSVGKAGWSVCRTQGWNSLGMQPKPGL